MLDKSRNNKIKLLMIDASDFDYFFITNILSKKYKNQYRFSHVKEAWLGLRKFRKKNLDCILLNCVLPDMDGINVVKLICNELLQKELPIVMMVSSMDDHLVKEAMVLGVRQFLVKGKFLHHDLHLAIQAAIHRSQISKKLILQSHCIHHIKYYDQVTRLPNKNKLIQVVDNHIAKPIRRNNPYIALILIHISRFRSINQFYGRSVADQVLLEVANRLRKIINSNDLVAHLAVGEFVMYFSQMESQGCLEKSIDQVRTCLVEAICLGEHTITLQVQISSTLQQPKDVNSIQLLQDLDIAMDLAKKYMSYRPVIFHQNMKDSIKYKKQLELDIRLALKNNLLEVVYQPIVDIRTHNIYGFDALLRLTDSRDEFVSFAEILPVAEETGLIIQIENFMLHEAVQALRLFHRVDSALFLHFNLTSQWLERGHVVEKIAQILQKSELEGKNFHLEIQEESLIGEVIENIHKIQQLAKMGVQFVIDKFGAGYSSLNYLKDLPIGIIKINGKFVYNLDKDNINKELCKGIIALGHSLGCEVFAEGISTKEQSNFLYEQGCIKGQGYFFYPALTMEDLLQKLLEQKEYSYATSDWQAQV